MKRDYLKRYQIVRVRKGERIVNILETTNGRILVATEKAIYELTDKLRPLLWKNKGAA